MAISQMSGSYLCKPQARVVPVKSWIRSLSSRPRCQEITGGFSQKKRNDKTKQRSIHRCSTHHLAALQMLWKRHFNVQRQMFVFPAAPFTTAEVAVTLRLHIVSISLFSCSFAKQAAKLNVWSVCEIILLVCNGWRLGCKNLWETEGKEIPDSKDG